ncbi:hypothetical protein AB5I41_11855 [Sphingomonas sp. MMS24-JH45]
MRLPAGKGPFPVAVVIHGGCWLSSIRARARRRWRRRCGDAGSRCGISSIAAPTIPAGVARDLRGCGRGRRSSRVAGEALSADLSRATVVGHSAGAHLALWVASRRKLATPSAPGRVTPVSIVAIDGPGALEPFVGIDADVCGKPVIVPLMGGTPAEKPDAYRIGSPANMLPFGTRQLLVEAELGPLMKPYAAAARAKGTASRNSPRPAPTISTSSRPVRRTARRSRTGSQPCLPALTGGRARLTRSP